MTVEMDGVTDSGDLNSCVQILPAVWSGRRGRRASSRKALPQAAQIFFKSPEKMTLNGRKSRAKGRKAT